MSQFLLTKAWHDRLLTQAQCLVRASLLRKSKFKYQHDLVYLGNPLETNCSESSIVETERGISEQFIDHNSKDEHSYLFKHANQSIMPHMCKTEWVQSTK